MGTELGYLSNRNEAPENHSQEHQGASFECLLGGLLGLVEAASFRLVAVKVAIQLATEPAGDHS